MNVTDAGQPLLIYSNWIKNLPESSAEQVAGFAFDTLRHYEPLRHYCFDADLQLRTFRSGGESYRHWLLLMIQNHISWSDPFDIQELAVLLHCSAYTIVNTNREIMERQAERYKASYIKSLLTGDSKSAVFFEEKLLGIKEDPVLFSWFNISHSGFSFQAIHRYLIWSVNY